MPGYEITVMGLEDIAKRMESMQVSLRGGEMAHALRAGAKIIQKAAKSTAPRRGRGRIQRALIVRNLAVERSEALVGVVLKNQAWFGKKHEFGTSKLPARPFLRPAFDGNAAAVVEAIRADMQARLETIGAKMAAAVVGAEE